MRGATPVHAPDGLPASAGPLPEGGPEFLPPTEQQVEAFSRYVAEEDVEEGAGEDEEREEENQDEEGESVAFHGGRERRHGGRLQCTSMTRRETANVSPEARTR